MIFPGKNIAFALIASLLMFSCGKETPQTDAYPQVEPGAGVFVINEGNFQWGNSSISYYNRQSGETWHNLFRMANGENPGDVLQSASLHNGLLWLVLNNSGKIEVMDPQNGKRTNTISGFTSPRQMLWVNQDKAYVSDLYSNGVHIVDLSTGSITGIIDINGWTEALISSQDKVIVTALETGMIYSVDPADDILTDSLYVGAGANSMVIDNTGSLWVLCGGDLEDNSGSRLVKVDTATWKVIDTIELTGKSLPWSRLTICNEGRQLYFLGGGVYRFDTASPGNQPEEIIEGAGMILYGLSVDPSNGDLYISDAIDYVQQGKVMRYSSDGILLDDFLARIIPGGFLFY